MAVRAQSLRIALLLSLSGAFACADGGIAPPPGEPASVVVDNQSQFTLVEVRRHPAPDHVGTQNMLSEPLEINDTLLLHGSGNWYMTVVRVRNRGGPLLAFTTAMPIPLRDDKGYRLLVFDGSFRLQDDEFVKAEVVE